MYVVFHISILWFEHACMEHIEEERDENVPTFYKKWVIEDSKWMILISIVFFFKLYYNTIYDSPHIHKTIEYYFSWIALEECVKSLYSGVFTNMIITITNNKIKPTKPMHLICQGSYHLRIVVFVHVVFGVTIAALFWFIHKTIQLYNHWSRRLTIPVPVFNDNKLSKIV